MSFVRPEARMALWRWREVLIGSGLLALALIWALTGFGLLRWLAIAAAVGAAVFIAAGVQRARFRGPDGGRGVVQIDERQITYFGPLSGGTIALSEIGTVTLDHASRPKHWMLVPKTGGELRIPVDASGAELLFDAFAGLPGMKTERMLGALRTGEVGQTVIWRRPDVQTRVSQLH